MLVDSQVVAHIFWPPELGSVAAGVPYYFTEETPPHPSCRPTRDLLLHDDGVAQLAARETSFLEHLGEHNRVRTRL